MKHFIKITFVVQYGVCTILFLSLVNDQTIIVSHDDELVSISNTVTDLIAKIAYIPLVLGEISSFSLLYKNGLRMVDLQFVRTGHK
jgi:hypothetical protein